MVVHMRAHKWCLFQLHINFISVSFDFRSPHMYWHSFKLWKCPAEMPTQKNTNSDHGKGQRVKAISQRDALATCLPTGMCIVPLISAASASNVAQHLFTLCRCHACMCGEEVHTRKNCQLGEGYTCTYKNIAFADTAIVHHTSTNCRLDAAQTLKAFAETAA